MGEEVRQGHFHQRDFARYETLLREETDLVARWFERRRFARRGGVGGFELEAWLIDAHGRPVPKNEEFLDRLGSPLVVPELARYNIEINTAPRALRDDALSRFLDDLRVLWQRCEAVAATLGASPVMIGILPTVSESDLSLDSMSDRVRYRALNEQVLRLREGTPLRLEIDGENPLRTFHRDVMLEAATTSFQLHLQVAADEAVRYFNASCVLAAPMVAACANSPFLFGHALWNETRIPLFEQAVSVEPSGERGGENRVTFGRGYARDSLMECFLENRDRYPILLPVLSAEPRDKLPHLRLHNGTIWRWNRPLIGFEDDGTPHLRIEHRVIPAGPSIVDSIANAALYYGLVRRLAGSDPAPESGLPFGTARENFYAAARHGLAAEVTWLDGRRHVLRTLLLDELIPAAHDGLAVWGINAEDRARFLDVIQRRVETGQTGSGWQRQFVSLHGPDWPALLLAYLKHQRSGDPVHQWDY